MKDTEGRAFVIGCSDATGCTVVPHAASGQHSGAALTLRSEGRVLGVCERGAQPISCRPLVCEEDGDCPTVDGVARTCTRSLCSEPSRKLTQTDVVMLCMAGSGVGYDTALQRERYAVALASGDSQSLPVGCRRP